MQATVTLLILSILYPFPPVLVRQNITKFMIFEDC